MRFFEIALGATASSWDTVAPDNIIGGSPSPESYIVNRAERIADEVWRRWFRNTI